MEKNVYEVSIVTTLVRNNCNIEEVEGPHYILTDKQRLARLENEINNEYDNWQEAYEAVESQHLVNKAFIVTESIFGKPRITHYDVFRQPFHTKPSQFKTLKVRLKAREYIGTIKDYAEKLSADDFIEYCLDKGIQVKEEYYE